MTYCYAAVCRMLSVRYQVLLPHIDMAYDAENDLGCRTPRRLHTRKMEFRVCTVCAVS